MKIMKRFCKNIRLELSLHQAQKSRTLWLAMLMLNTVIVSGQTGRGKENTPRPNIVFILADDLGYFDLSSYGNKYWRTPNIDRIAADGVRFTQAYVASPVCSPSRAAILTAKHPARLHLTNFLIGNRVDSTSKVLPANWTPELKGKEITLAELLKREGYATAIVGKWHLGWSDSSKASAQGFDYDRIIGSNGLDYYNYSITSDNKTIFEDDGSNYLTDKLTDYGVGFIEENQSSPFFLMMSYSAPHVLLVPRGDKLKKHLFNYNKSGNAFNPYYAAMMESLDDGVGKIVDRLKSLGLDDNTIVVFTSDNGGVGLPELGPTPTSVEPLRGWKGHVHEGGIRVPLIVRWPGRIPAGSVTTQYITGTDYLPTFMELLGSRVDHQIGGRSFLPVLYNPEKSFDRGPIYWHYPHFSNQEGRPAGGVRLGDYKLVENYETGEAVLYNLAGDEAESRDISDSFPSKKKELGTLFLKWKNQVNANMPRPNPLYGKISK